MEGYARRQVGFELGALGIQFLSGKWEMSKVEQNKIKKKINTNNK
jgi:hypothetical protein